MNDDPSKPADEPVGNCADCNRELYNDEPKVRVGVKALPGCNITGSSRAVYRCAECELNRKRSGSGMQLLLCL